MPPFTLRITGSASVVQFADQAILKISASSTGPSRQSVSDEVLRTANHIDDLMHQLQTRSVKGDQAAAQWSQTSLSTNSWAEHMPRATAEGHEFIDSGSGIPGPTASDPDQSMFLVRRYQARIGFDLRFSGDFSLMSDYAAHVASLEHCEIQSLRWILLPTTNERLQSQLRYEAAANARRKAQDYCRALCPTRDATIVPTELSHEKLVSGPVSSVVHENTTTLFGNTQSSVSGNAQPRAASADTVSGSELCFTPEEISMTFSIELVFTVETNGFKLDAI